MARLRPDRTWLAYIRPSDKKPVSIVRASAKHTAGGMKLVAVFSTYHEADEWLRRGWRARG